MDGAFKALGVEKYFYDYSFSLCVALIFEANRPYTKYEEIYEFKGNRRWNVDDDWQSFTPELINEMAVGD